MKGYVETHDEYELDRLIFNFTAWISELSDIIDMRRQRVSDYLRERREQNE